MGHWISALWTRRVIEVAARHGERPAELWAMLGQDGRAIDPEARVPDERHLLLWDRILAPPGREALPLEVAAAMDLDDYEALALACKTAPTLAEAIDRLRRYLGLWTDAVQLEERAGRLGWELRLTRAGPRTIGRQGSLVSALGELAQAVRRLSGWTPQAVLLRGPPLGDPASYQRFFAAPLRSGAGSDGLLYSGAAREAPLPLADGALSRFVLGHLEARRGPAGDVLRDVREAIARALPDGTPLLGQVARRLAISPRTLQRRLGEAGLGYGELLADVRRGLAEQLLRESGHSLSEIAFLVGFSEQSAFTRAFRRWTGAPPSALRARRRAGP